MPSFISVSLHIRSELTRSPLTIINYALVLLVLFWLCRYLVLVLLYLLPAVVMPWIDIISFDVPLFVSQYASRFPILISIACLCLCIVFDIYVDFYSFCCFADEFFILKNGLKCRPFSLLEIDSCVLLEERAILVCFILLNEEILFCGLLLPNAG